MTSPDGARIFVGLGELLWDMLPGGRQLGGAPANFAYISSLFGNRAIVASRVGRDALGSDALDNVCSLGVDTSYIQLDAVHPTSTVIVKVGTHGQATFTITEEVAWDYLAWTPDWEHLARTADVICFGSLAQRSPKSRATIRAFLQSTRPAAVRVFDVNLRQSFYDRQVLSDSFSAAQIAKLNDDELPAVLSCCGLPPTRDEIAGAELLLRTFALDLVCLTRGAAGSLLVSSSGIHEHKGFSVSVVDTVGSGDAFTATLAHYYGTGMSLADMNAAANRVGSWVATQAGATPRVAAQDFQLLLRDIA